jgi:hypothetical protein
MDNILRSDLDQDHEICMTLSFNVFLKKGFEIRNWIENKKTKEHVTLESLVHSTDQRLQMNYSSKALKGIIHLMRINMIDIE